MYLHGATLLSLATFIRPIIAKNITFINPPDKSAFDIKTKSWFLIQWTSDFAMTDLTIFAGPIDNKGTFAYEVLGAALTQQYTSYNWTAGPVAGADLKYNIHIELANSKNHSCAGCVTNSAIIRVSDNGNVYQDTSDSSGGSTAPTSTITSGSTSAPTQPPATDGGGDDSSSTSLRVGLGVGLGVGIPVLIAAAGFLYLLRKRRGGRNGDLASTPVVPPYTADPKYAPVPMTAGELDTQQQATELGTYSSQSPYPNQRFELDSHA